jgi:hypothetical protein
MAPPPAVVTPPQEPFQHWLEEVRAQRELREELRRATKEASDARRRWINPWGAAQQEAREQANQRRREELMGHIERDRMMLRNQVPWRVQQGPLQGTPPKPVAEKPPWEDENTSTVPGESEPTASNYPPPQWDNRWYYRGF